MLRNAQPSTVVDVETENSSDPPVGLPASSSSNRRPLSQGDDVEEHSQLLPKSPASEVKSVNGSLNNLSRLLSRSQTPIPQIIPAGSKMPFNNNKRPHEDEERGDGERNNNNSSSVSTSSPTSPTLPIVPYSHPFGGPAKNFLTPPITPTTPLATGDNQIISFSAPASPSAGSKSQHNQLPSHSAFNTTLTSIDLKFRKWISSKYGRVRKRVIFKNGEVNLSQTKVSKRKRKYLADLFTTLVDIQWRWTLLIFTLSFILSWLFFAFIWWTTGYLHGDLDPENIQLIKDEKFTPCFGNFNGFTSAFLFSIETQHTIGYGFRYTTEECPFAIFLMCTQSILGVMIQAVMVGIIFAKMSRPKKRTQTLVFSRHAVICQRDGELCLMFRVGDMRKSHIISANARAQLIKRRVTKEGEVLPFYQHELKVGVDADQSQIFFIWPMMVVHKIDKESPLYGVSAHDLPKERFEIVVILEGVIETTGATTQARSSYLPSEILWGHRFENMVSFRKEIGEYAVDHALFNHTYEISTPLSSAKELDEINRFHDDMRREGNNKLLTPFRVPAIAQYSIP